MADKTNNLTIFLKEIADAIRYVKGTTDPINPQDFAFIIKGLADKLVGEVDVENTISLIMSMVGFSGTYTLKYEDKQRIPLDNFADICTITLSNSDAYYEDLIDVNIPPYLAENIGVYDSDNIRIGYIPLTGFKPTFAERLYRVGLLSDVHDYEGSQAEPSEDFRNALNLFNNKEDVVMTCICGDISQNGTTSEFSMFQSDVAAQSPDTPVYTTTGNHDCGGSSNSTINESTWEQYTGHPLTFEITRTLDNGKNDHFLFLGMNKWSLGTNGTPYKTESIDWLESKLKEYKNERCFVFTHLFFPDRAGNLNDIYPTSNWLQGSQLSRLEGLHIKFFNSIWFSGHSHWKWALQKYQDRANVYRDINSDNLPASGWSVHIPSCASPIDSNGSTRVEKPLESEGAVMDVYENYIDIRAIDLKSKKYIPIGTYRLNTELFEVLDFIAINSSDFRHLPASSYDKNNNGKDINGNTSNCPYAEMDQATGTLKIYFDNTSQKLLFESPLFISGTTKTEDIHLTAKEIKVYHNDIDITNDSRYSTIIKNGVGWFLTDDNYSLSVPTDAGVYADYPTTQRTSIFGNTTYNGIQFNVSNSKYYEAGTSAGLTDDDLFPIRVELKGLSFAVSSASEVSEVSEVSEE